MNYIQQAKAREKLDGYTDYEITQALHAQFQEQTGQNISFDDFAREAGLELETRPLAIPGQTQPEPIQAPEPQPLPDHPPLPNVQGDIPRFSGLGVDLSDQQIQPPPLSEVLSAPFKSIPAMGKQIAGGLGQAISEDLNKDISTGLVLFGMTSALPVQDEIVKGIVTADEALSESAEVSAKLYQRGTEEMEKLKPKGMTPLQEFTYDVSVAGVKMVPAVGATVATRNPWAFAAVFYPDVYANKYAALRQQGIPAEEAGVHAHVASNIEILTERIPIGNLVEMGKPMMRRMIEAVVGEGAQEAVSGILQGVYDKATTNPELTFREIMQQAGYEGLMGAALGAGMGVATHPIVKTQEKLDQAQLRKEIESYLQPTEKLGPDPEQQAIESLKPSTKVLVKAVNEEKQPVAETSEDLPETETVKLYRAESPTVKFDDVFDREGLNKAGIVKTKKGDFWTSDKNYAEYMKESYGPDAEIKTVEIPASEAEKYQQAPGEYVLPNEKATTATEPTKPEVVEQIQEGQTNTKLDLAEARKNILAQIDDRIARAPTEIEIGAELSKMGGQKYTGETLRKADYVHFDVPGDGKFKVVNIKEHLQEFRKKVSASAGFKEVKKKPTKPVSNYTATIKQMIKDGELDNARELASLRGMVDKFPELKTGVTAEVPESTAKPQTPKTPKQSRQQRGATKAEPVNDANKPPESGETKASTRASRPGNEYRPMLQAMDTLPEKPTDRAISHKAKRPKREQSKPIRRETIIKDLEKAFGVKIYQGRVKGKTRLGFYRKTNDEIRTKNKNDLEVTAHEVAHWLDERYPAFQKAYRKGPYRQEMKGVSYDATKLYEGFAEFMRLYMTQESEAVLRAPKFYEKFQEIIDNIGIRPTIDKLQEDMHAWYEQGAIDRLKSKVGKPDISISTWLKDVTDRWTDKAIQNVFDAMQGIKIAERELTGDIATADISPYKNARLVAGSRGVARAVFEHGTIAIAENGDIVFTGKGLRQVFEPVADVLDDALLYFIAKRAQELKSQDRENLIRSDEIRAGLKLGQDNPKIREAHKEYQAFNKRMMDFYEQTGLVGPSTRKAMEEMNKNYVPFHRVLETATGENITGSTKTPFKRLSGGTGNINDIMDNITYGTSSLIHMALINRAKQLTYRMVARTKDGAKFAVKIPKNTQAAKVDQRQVIDTFVQGLLGIKLSEYNKLSEMGQGNPMMDKVLALLETNLNDFATFFTFGHIPQGNNIDTVLFSGERTAFEIADPIFLKSIQAFGPRASNLALRFAGGFKNVLTRCITTLPDFQIPNLLRDSFSAYTLSKGRMVPVIDSVKGLVDRLKADDIYWQFMVNGGGFSSTVQGETMRRELEKFYIDQHINPKNVLHTPRRLLDKWDEINSAFEYGTRLAEYKKVREKGGSMREAAYSGREISTDFAMRGTSDFLRIFTSTVPFMNARMQGLYRLAREVHEGKGKAKLIGENAAQFALRGLIAITLPTLALYLMNRDDERYKALPDWVKDLHWVIFVPGSDAPILIPKPFEIGQIFATIPERTAELIEKKDGKKFADSMLWIAGDALSLNPTPQVIKPAVDLAMNRNWTGAPIIPEDLRGAEAWLQYRPWTSETMIALGEHTGLSPIAMEHVVRGYFGTLGMYTLMSSDYLINDRSTGEKPDLRLDQAPVIRRFIRQAPYRGTQYETDFYKLAEEVEKVARSFNLMQKRVMVDDAKRYLDKEERKILFGMSKAVSSIKSTANALNQQMRRVSRDKILTGREKRKELDVLQQQKNDLFRQARQQLNPDDFKRLRQ